LGSGRKNEKSIKRLKKKKKAAWRRRALAGAPFYGLLQISDKVVHTLL